MVKQNIIEDLDPRALNPSQEASEEREVVVLDRGLLRDFYLFNKEWSTCEVDRRAVLL